VLEETADSVTLVQEWDVLLVVRDLRGWRDGKVRGGKLNNIGVGIKLALLFDNFLELLLLFCFPWWSCLHATFFPPFDLLAFFDVKHRLLVF